MSIIDYLVQNEIIKQQAAEMKVTVTQQQLDERIKQVTEQVGGQKKLDALLKKQGVTMEQLNTQLEAQMLQEAVRAKVGESSKVTAEQIKAYFDDPKNKAQFVVADSVDARHVLVDTKAEALKVQKLLAADPSDANWKKVAKKYSIDPGTKDKGGALGNFGEGRMVPEFDKVAFSLKPGTDLSARQDAVRLARHRGHQEDPGFHEDLRGSQVHDRAVAQVPGAVEGLGDLARRRREAGRCPVRGRLRPQDAHGFPEPQRFGGSGPVADELTEPAHTGCAAAP